MNYSVKERKSGTFLHDLILNRKDAKDAKVLLMPFPDRNRRSGKTQCPGKTTGGPVKMGPNGDGHDFMHIYFDG